MMDMFYMMLFFNLLNAYVIFDFMDQMYGRIYSSRRIYFFSYVVFVILHVSVNMQRIVLLNIGYEFFCICVSSYYLYQKTPRKYFYNLLFVVYLLFMDEGSCVIYSVLKEQTIFLSFVNEYDIFLSGLLNFALLLLTYQFYIYMFQKSRIDAVSIQQNFLFAILIILEILIILYFTRSQIESFGVVGMFFILSFFCLDLYIIYLFRFVSRNNALLNEVNLFHQQSVMLNNNIHDVEHKYEQSRKVIHDVRNYLQILRELYRKGERGMAEKYENQLSEKLNEIEYRFYCENRILCILINDILMIAKSKGISMCVRCEDLDWNFISEIDLTTLFANLLNNAIEACDEVEMIEKSINVRVCELNDCAVIRVSNSYCKEHLRWKGKKLISTKQGHTGVGIGNIYTVVQKYNGNIKFETVEQVFIAKIILSMEIE